MAKLYTRKRGKTWYYSFEAEATAEGKRKRVEKGGFATEKEAMTAGAKAFASYLSGNIALTSEKIPLQEFLSDWLERKAAEVRQKTLIGYTASVKRIIPIIGAKTVQQLRPKDVDTMMRQLAAKGYSRGTLSVTLNALKDALSCAVYPDELIQTSPAQYIKVPRNAPCNVVKRTIIRKEKLDELLQAFPFGHPFHMPIMVMYHTGMRIGETFGLAWDAVDLARGIIHVMRQMVYLPAAGHKLAPPKTQSSVRDIRIGPELVSLLKRWKAQQAANEIKYGMTYRLIYEDKDGGIWQMHKQSKPPAGAVRRSLVCTQENGKFAGTSAFWYALHAYGVNPHSLRHTHATLCAENGASPKGLAGRLGHKQTSITEDLYTHETEAMQESTLEAFEKSVRKIAP